MMYSWWTVWSASAVEYLSKGFWQLAFAELQRTPSQTYHKILSYFQWQEIPALAFFFSSTTAHPPSYQPDISPTIHKAHAHNWLRRTSFSRSPLAAFFKSVRNCIAWNLGRLRAARKTNWWTLIVWANLTWVKKLGLYIHMYVYIPPRLYIYIYPLT